MSPLYRLAFNQREGCARVQAQLGQIFADEFSRYAVPLANLTRDEIVVLSKCMKLWKEHTEGGQWKGGVFPIDLHKRLAPSIFTTSKHVNTTLSSASRSGLLFITGVQPTAKPHFTKPHV